MKLLALICSLLTAWAQPTDWVKEHRTWNRGWTALTNPTVFLTLKKPLLLQGEGPNFIVLWTPSTNGPITKTNNLLTIHDAPKDVPNGPVMLTIKTVTEGGESEPETIWINLQRPPARPVIRPVSINADESKVQTMEDLMFLRRRERAQIMAPAPPGALIPVVAPPAPTPLPNGLPASYRQHLEREQAGVRRGQ